VGFLLLQFPSTSARKPLLLQPREKGVHLYENFPCFMTTETQRRGHREQSSAALKRRFTRCTGRRFLPRPEEGSSTRRSPKPGETRMTEPQKEIFLRRSSAMMRPARFKRSFSGTCVAIESRRIARRLNTVIARNEALVQRWDPEGELLAFLRQS